MALEASNSAGATQAAVAAAEKKEEVKEEKKEETKEEKKEEEKKEEKKKEDVAPAVTPEKNETLADARKHRSAQLYYLQTRARERSSSYTGSRQSQMEREERTRHKERE